MTPDPSVVDLPVDGIDIDRNGSDPSVDPVASPMQAAQSDNGSLPLLFGFIGVILAIGFLKTWWFPGIVAGLLFMLFMHELGHYLTARASGMKVTEFFLGFGPKIWSFNRGETEYGVKAIPAGAYVRIIGMTNLDEIDPAEEHRTYRAQPYWQRMMTICAGSAMHFLMATIALFVLFVSYGYNGFNGPPWYVDVVIEGSTASELGIQIGDEIVSINNQTFANWDEFGDVVSGLQEGPVDIAIRRADNEILLVGELGLRPEDVLLDGFGLYLLEEDPAVGLQAAVVWPQESADAFGFEQGDVVLSIDDVERPDQIAMAAMLRERNGEELEIQVLRDSQVVSLVGTARDDSNLDALLEEFGIKPTDRLLRLGSTSVTDEASLRQAFADQAGEIVRVQVLRGGETLRLESVVKLRTVAPFRGFFGVGPEFVPEAEPGIGQSAGLAIRDFGVISQTNMRGLADMINPARWLGSGEPAIDRRAPELARQAQQENAPPVTQCDAPDSEDTSRPLSIVGIGRLISCSESVDQVLFLFAVVNIFVGLFNLLPLLPVDGGHAVIATYERARELVTRKPHRVDAAKLIPLTWVVILLLVGVGVWTTALDIFSWPGS